ncbi:hypothetical protein AB8O64_26165 [Streptomyces sp. QH1-20]|uniref:hypothetical protein n=1 Tax=Streptomyces sp. QH1-20 TaxID=3240934 RepID=UPI0035179055
MLSLRLARGAHPLVLLRRLLVAAAAAGVGFLLLCTLGHAVAHPKEAEGSVVRLLWCVVPLAAVVQFAVAVARTDPATRLREGLDAVGLGPVALSLLAAVSTALSCAVGSCAALLIYLELRGNLHLTTLSGSATKLLDGGEPLPWAAALTLLSLLPVLAGAACAVMLRPAEQSPEGGSTADDTSPAVKTPEPKRTYSGLPWGVAVIATGLALESYASDGSAPPAEALLNLPGRADGASPGLVGGWLLACLGFCLAGPGLTHWCGVLLSAGRPGPVRLLAGRILQDAAPRLGRPLGVLCAVASGALVAVELYGAAWEPSGARPFGPLTGLGAALVMACVTATALTAALDTRQSRADTAATLLRLGIPASLLRSAAAVRTCALVAVMAPLTWVVGELAAMPLTR